MEAYVITAIILAVVILAVISILSLWKKMPQDKAMVVTGLKKRVISGGGGFVIPILERTDKISLQNMKILVKTDGALTEQGVDLIVDGVAVLKVRNDRESVLAAVEQFNTGNEHSTIEAIEGLAKDVLEGKLREIISKLTVEDIYKDREKFASNVQEVAAQDLSEMGLEIKAFTIRDISDNNGYLHALGKSRIAVVKRDADIAEAEAAKETKIKTAEANRLGEEARLNAEAQIAAAQKEKEIKVQAFRKDTEIAKAASDLAYDIEANKVKQEVTETEMKVAILRKQKETELATFEAERKELELVSSVKKIADAERYKYEQNAQANKFGQIQDATAHAEAIRLEGVATADAIRERGNAEAEAMLKKAEAFKQYNDAAVTQMIIEKLPAIAAAVSEPLSKTEKIVIVDSGSGSGGGAQKIARYVTDIAATLPDMVESVTGIDLKALLRKKDIKDINE
ncbi:membrane protein [Clostridia bacterium]|nr:membrane protein [Clostridia bacterium]